MLVGTMAGGTSCRKVSFWTVQNLHGSILGPITADFAAKRYCYYPKSTIAKHYLTARAAFPATMLLLCVAWILPFCLQQQVFISGITKCSLEAFVQATPYPTGSSVPQSSQSFGDHSSPALAPVHHHVALTPDNQGVDNPMGPTSSRRISR